MNPIDAAETLRGVVHRTYFSAPTFSAGVLRTDDGQFVRFRGKFCAVEGDAVALVGAWKTDPKYGLQFDADGLSYDLPQTRDGLVLYLAAHPAFKGIGPKTAERIVDFAGGLEALDRLIREAPGQLHERLKVPVTTVTTLRDAWIAPAAENEVRTYLAGFGLTHHQATVLLETFGE
ncbi:MAG: AAA family ATPase, partial [Phycisphaerae bacterium]|nr:AAA family ATPase [Phycisphaerae bacterium]